MASGIFLLLDDIAVLADDVAVTTKIATKKTVGILGDDVAVSAQQATGFEQQRELIIIWAIIKGSLRNKLIILPFAFILSLFASFLIPFILTGGAFYLLFEGVEKIEEYVHHLLNKNSHNNENKKEILSTTNTDVLELEQAKIKSAVFTDFILSIEIIIMALNAVIDESLTLQIFAVSFVAVITTFGVYGLVAAIVRIDNVGFWLISKKYIKSGNFLISLMPKIIKVLGIVGTVAMLLVGGGILIHNVSFVHHLFHPSIFNSLLVGLLGGIIALIFYKMLVNPIILKFQK